MLSVMVLGPVGFGLILSDSVGLTGQDEVPAIIGRSARRDAV